MWEIVCIFKYCTVSSSIASMVGSIGLWLCSIRSFSNFSFLLLLPKVVMLVFSKLKDIFFKFWRLLVFLAGRRRCLLSAGTGSNGSFSQSSNIYLVHPDIKKSGRQWLATSKHQSCELTSLVRPFHVSIQRRVSQYCSICPQDNTSPGDITASSA